MRRRQRVWLVGSAAPVAHQPDDRPSRSITFYAAGGPEPEDVARRVLDDADEWLADGNVESMPVPKWMRH